MQVTYFLDVTCLLAIFWEFKAVAYAKVSKIISIHPLGTMSSHSRFHEEQGYLPQTAQDVYTANNFGRAL